MLRLVSPQDPADLAIVSVADAKAHSRIFHDEDDAQVLGAVLAATGMLESETQRRFVRQTIEWVLPCWRASIRFPVAPIASVESINYTAPGGVQATVDPAAYVAVTSGQTKAIRPRAGRAWPALDPDAAEPIVITFLAGDERADVAATVKQACVLLAAHFYENREAVIAAPSAAAVVLPLGVENLIGPERWE